MMQALAQVSIPLFCSVSTTGKEVDHASNGIREILKSTSQDYKSVEGIGERLSNQSLCLEADICVFSHQVTGFLDITRLSWENRIFELRKYLAKSIDEDYLRGDIILLEGWVMSKTEALYCVTTHRLELKNKEYAD